MKTKLLGVVAALALLGVSQGALFVKAKRLAVSALAGALGAALICLSVQITQAATIYTYTGNNFNTIIQDDPQPSGTYTTSMSVSGSLVLANPLIANLSNVDIVGSLLSFSFFDGRGTISNLSGPGVIPDHFNITTDAFGNIIAWDFSILTGQLPVLGAQGQVIDTIFDGSLAIDVGELIECTSFAITCQIVGQDTAKVQNSVGTWSATPLPGALPLFATGLGALGLLGWRRKRKAAA
jgi:hypothetical protein